MGDQYLKVHVVKGPGDKKKKHITIPSRPQQENGYQKSTLLSHLKQGFPILGHRQHQPIYTCRPYWKIITHAMNTGAALHHSKRTTTIRTAKIRDKFYNKAFNYN